MAEISVGKGQSAVTVVLRRSARARRMSLRVSGLDGRVTLTVPERTSTREARAFAESQGTWIAAAQARVPRPRKAGEAATLPFEGRVLSLERRPLRAVRLDGDADRLLVPEGPGAGRAIRRYLMLAARQRLAAAAAAHAVRFGREVAGIALRDTRSRWGSCSTAGRLSFSWRLIMTPPAVLDYVALHEAAHLVHMNHGPRFWGLVEEACPDYRRHRDWLRAEGPGLHAWDFDD